MTRDRFLSVSWLVITRRLTVCLEQTVITHTQDANDTVQRQCLSAAAATEVSAESVDNVARTVPILDFTCRPCTQRNL